MEYSCLSTLFHEATALGQTRRKLSTKHIKNDILNPHYFICTMTFVTLYTHTHFSIKTVTPYYFFIFIFNIYIHFVTLFHEKFVKRKKKISHYKHIYLFIYLYIQ
ncbi:hypothetical protein PV327_003510 [Microctonus hyperodae]|uniref:Uncharacterized protein n=1 Tax=Microctonus hyperodae TaxID=165561 RepID=A0AA39L0Y7_MICHY|nr:hypothetical protein PV327_003510 [Microctonus hyperodae]